MRARRARRLVGVALAAVAMVVGSALPADAAVSITARLSASSVRLGGTVTIEGTVSEATASPRVVLQRAVGGVWSDRDAAAVDPTTGAFSITVRPGQAGTYLLRVRSAGGSIASSTLTLRVTGPPTIAARLTATKITVGTTTTIRGTVAPAGATPRVVLQRSVGGRWSDRDAANVDPTTGAFTISLRPSQAGVYTMRVRSNGGSVLSKVFYLKVSPAPVPVPVPTPTPPAPTPRPPAPAPSPSCDPNYSGGCVPIASDVDCAGGSGNGPAYVQGPVNVVGNDIYDLDRDNDGIGCED